MKTITLALLILGLYSCGPNKREIESKQGIPESVIKYSGIYKQVNDSIATWGRFVYEKHRSNSGEYRYYLMNPIR